MSDNGDPGFTEDGIHWDGTREQLRAWKAYKLRKARIFVLRGYAVSWAPDPYDWMDVYLPERPHAGAHELRAEARLLVLPEQAWTDGSRVAELTIYQRRIISVLALPSRNPIRLMREEENRVFYNNRHPQINELSSSPEASRLHKAILEEFR